MTDRPVDAELQAWRSWVQFVWKYGDKIEGTDEELQRVVCVRFDELNGRLSALLRALAAIEAEMRENCFDDIEMANRIKALRASAETEP